MSELEFGVEVRGERVVEPVATPAARDRAGALLALVRATGVEPDAVFADPAAEARKVALVVRFAAVDFAAAVVEVAAVFGAADAVEAAARGAAADCDEADA